MDISTLGAAKSYTDSAINGLSINVQSDWNETDNTSDAFIKNKPTIIAEIPEYNIIKVQDDDYVFVYQLTKTIDEEIVNVGEAINIPKDMVVQSGDVKTCSVANVPVQGYKVGDKYIDLLIANSNNQHIYILVSDLVDNNASGIKYDNTSSGLAATNVQTAINELNTNKASTTELTVHTNNNNIHVTAADKTAWDMMPKSKGESYVTDTHNYQDFIIPILNIASTYSNEYFYGQIYLKRINATGNQMTIINLMCGKNYNEEKAVYYIDRSEIWTSVKPCSFMYNGKKMFGIHVKITSSDYNILRVDAMSTTDFGIITPVYIYNNNTSAVLNAEIYNSLTFFDGYNMPMNFYEIPKVIKSDGTVTKLLSFSSVPATLTSSGTIGDIAYDTNYLYMCTAANTWKKTAWGADVYSTTETVVGTYMGKPLYRKVVDCGGLPNNTSKEVPHGVSNINIITNISGTGYNGIGFIPLPTASITSPVVIYSDKSKIEITTVTDRSLYTKCNVTLEYTKTTD